MEENLIIQDSTAVQVDSNIDQGVQVPADTEGVAITQTPIESSDLATVEPTTTPVSDVSGVQINSNPYASDKGIEQVETPNIGVDSSGPTVPAYTDVEIGGGRITGKEISSEHPEGIKFGMYSANKYMEPQGKHSVVESIDGNKWYKQYSVDTVQKRSKFLYTRPSV